MNIILFDGVCNLCNYTVHILLKHDKNNKLFFAAQQTSAGISIMNEYKIEANNQSVIFIKDKQVFFKSKAVFEIAKLLTGWPSLFKYLSFLPVGASDWFYTVIAKNRYKVFGKQDKCSVPNKAHLSKFI